MPLTPLERKAQMVLRQVTQVAVAAETGFTQGYVAHVVAGIGRNAQIEEVIARQLGMPAESVFGPRVPDTAVRPEDAAPAEPAPCD